MRCAACALVALVGTAATADPLPPSAPLGRWVVEGRAGELDCVLSRDFGDAAHPIGLAIRPSLAGRVTVLVSFQTKTLQRLRATTGKVTLLPAGLVVSGDRSFKFAPDLERETMAVTFNPTRTQALLAGLVDASAIGVEVGERNVLLSTGPTRAAATALAGCQAQLAQSLGANQAAFIHPASESALEWVKPEDYPPSDRAALPASRAVMLLTIERDGKPTACRAAVPSGHPASDEATCRALLRRAHYDPAPGSSPRHAVIRMSWTAIGSSLIPVAENSF